TLGARYDAYNPDADATEQQAANRVPINVSSSTLALTAGWRYHRVARVLLELELNRNALGRTTGGLPTTLAATVLTLRTEVAF
ncbi:MAG: hypothetical protein ACT4TC_11910, partial [Myxococcaceae bacterium]